MTDRSQAVIPDNWADVPLQADVDELRDLLDLMANFPNNDQRARFLLSSNWLRHMIGVDQQFHDGHHWTWRPQERR